MGVSGSLQVKDGKYYAVLSLRTNELTKKENQIQNQMDFNRF